MRFELGLEQPDPQRVPISAVTIGGSYIVGGLIPLIRYMLARGYRFGLMGELPDELSPTANLVDVAQQIGGVFVNANCARLPQFIGAVTAAE